MSRVKIEANEMCTEVSDNTPETKECVIIKHAKKVSNWHDIADKIKKKEDDFKIGDMIECRLMDGQQVKFVITDVTDEYVRFETKDFIGERDQYLIHSVISGRGGYPKSSLKNYIDGQIWRLLPEDLREVISDTKRFWKDLDGNINEYETKLFLPSASEVFPEEDCYGDKKLYKQLKYYKDIRNRIRVNKDGYEREYWLSSVSSNKSSFACCINEIGLSAIRDVRQSLPATPICFLLSRN